MVRSLCLVSCLLLALFLVSPCSGYPSDGSYYRDEGQYEPEEIVDLINHLTNLLRMERKMETYKDDIISSDKRGLDLGLTRGYTGALQAKHLMGVAAANFAGGPGRKRRSVNTE